MTLDFFNEQMARLVGLRFKPADLQSHWEAAQKLPGDVFEAAVTRALSSQSDHPTPHELLTYADLVRLLHQPAAAPEADRRTPLETPYEFTIPETSKVVRVTDEWRFDCDRCSDSGMVSYWCGVADTPPPKPWYHRRTCERRQSHYDHEWVGPCPCAATNPTIQRRLQARQKYASEPATKQRGAA